VRRQLAQVLALDYDTLLAVAGAADAVVQEDLEAYPQRTEAVIQRFRTAQEREFHHGDQLCLRIEHGSKGGSSPCPWVRTARIDAYDMIVLASSGPWMWLPRQRTAMNPALPPSVASGAIACGNKRA
jgi:hypothetical protein